jgi:hypothetical protein
MVIPAAQIAIEFIVERGRESRTARSAVFTRVLADSLWIAADQFITQALRDLPAPSEGDTRNKLALRWVISWSDGEQATQEIILVAERLPQWAIGSLAREVREYFLAAAHGNDEQVAQLREREIGG